MIRIFFGVVAGAALAIGLFGLPNPLHKFLTEYQHNQKIQHEEENALAIVNGFEGSYRPDASCVRPNSELKRLECKNRRDMAFRSYVRQHVKHN